TVCRAHGRSAVGCPGPRPIPVHDIYEGVNSALHVRLVQSYCSQRPLAATQGQIVQLCGKPPAERIWRSLLLFPLFCPRTFIRAALLKLLVPRANLTCDAQGMLGDISTSRSVLAQLCGASRNHNTWPPETAREYAWPPRDVPLSTLRLITPVEHFVFYPHTPCGLQATTELDHELLALQLLQCGVNVVKCVTLRSLRHWVWVFETVVDYVLDRVKLESDAVLGGPYQTAIRNSPMVNI
ncbi:hypothetical protein BaRGS_00032546, partial [Batillaria attramentaria]